MTPNRLQALLSSLQSPSAIVRARAAARLGRLGGPAAANALLAALPGAVDEVCPILDALGEAGEPAAIPALRAYAARQLLSRRRSAVEALRRLGDEVGLAEARARALDRLPEPLRGRLLGLDEHEPTAAAVDVLVESLLSLPEKERGPALDTLYELATPLAALAVRKLLPGLPFERPGLWRGIKSVFKRSMLRLDHETFGLLAYHIEVKGRASGGTKASVKSGYDGAQRELLLFGRKTQNYLRRRAWRHLRGLASRRPEEYPRAAAEALIHYRPEDARTAQGLYGRFADCFLLNRILWSGGPRFAPPSRALRIRFRDAACAKAAPGAEEEAYPRLWSAQPEAYLRILSAARLPEAHPFAHRALFAEHRGVLREAPVGMLLGLLEAPYAPTVELATQELAGRFRLEAPDWLLLARLLEDARPQVREVGLGWMGRSASVWTLDWLRSSGFVFHPNAEIRAHAARLLVEHLPNAPSPVRRGLATEFLRRIQAPEPAEGEHEAGGRVLRDALLEEAARLLPVREWLELVLDGSRPAQALAGKVLGAREGAFEELGLEVVLAMAHYDLAAVRDAALSMLEPRGAALSLDSLFDLLESRWPGTREAGARLLLSNAGFGRLGFDGLMGLLDSSHPEAQSAGRELVIRHLAELDAAELLRRLMEHPRAEMRGFALELVGSPALLESLPGSIDSLEGKELFFRMLLLALEPRRAIKRRVLELVTRQGLARPEDAPAAARILAETLWMKTRQDFEAALEGLARLRLAHPWLESPVALAQGASP